MKNPILQICEEKNISPSNLARMSDVNFETVRRVIRGETKSISSKVLETLHGLDYNTIDIARAYEKWRKEIALSIKGA